MGSIFMRTQDEKEMERGFDRADAMVNANLDTQREFFRAKQGEYEHALDRFRARPSSNDKSGTTGLYLEELRALKREVKAAQTAVNYWIDVRSECNLDRTRARQASATTKLQAHRAKFTKQPRLPNPDKIESDREKADEFFERSDEIINIGRPVKADDVDLDEEVERDIAGIKEPPVSVNSGVDRMADVPLSRSGESMSSYSRQYDERRAMNIT